MRTIIHGMLISAALILFSWNGANAAPQTLDELLRYVKQSRAAEQKLNAEREARFKAARNQQASLLTKAKAELAAQEQRSETLRTAYDANEKSLSELETELKQRMGTIGEMFGVVRQVAGDASSQFQHS